MDQDTSPGEFDKFIDQLPDDIAQSLWFVPVREDKAPDIPEEEDLMDEKFRLSLEEARGRLEGDENVGVVLRDHLSVLDIITLEESEEYLKGLPPSLEVSTRGGNVHRYYLRGDGIEGRDIPNIVELRTGSRYVVVPGSYACDGEGNNWGTYTVRNSQKIAELSPSDLPPELKVKGSQKKGKGHRNKHGWRIEQIREDDEKFDALLTRFVPPNKGYVDVEEAHRETIRKLLYWEFDSKEILKVMGEYRKCESPELLFAEVVQDFEAKGADTISDRFDPDAYRPGSGAGKTVKRKTKRELEQLILDPNKEVRDDTAVPVTFASKIVLPSGEKIEEGDTFFLPSDLAAELREKEKAGRYVFRCPRCHELHFQDKPYKPSICQNPSCESNGKRTDGKFLKPLHPSDHEKRAGALMNSYHFKTVAASIGGTSAAGLIHLYERGVYDESEAMGFIRGKVQDMNSKLKLSDQNDVINYISVETQVSEEKFGALEGRVVVKNGTLDLETLELESHDPSELATSKIPVEYDPDAECPVFLDYLERMVPSEKDRRRLQELLGTALVGEKSHKKGAMVVGPTDAGKSTLIRIFRQVIGKDNVASQSPSTLADTRWGKAKLRNKLLNATDEVSSGRLEELAVLKRIMDGNSVEAEEKREKTFEFTPTCEHLYAANQTPSASRKDDAFWNRWIIIETPNPVPQSEQDPDLSKKIVEEEAWGILNWIIRGYKKFVENGRRFTYPVEWEESRDKWLTWGDTIQRFIQRCIEVDENARISTNELHELHTEFARNHELDTVSQHKLTQEIKKLSYANYSRGMRFENGDRGGIRGIGVELPGKKESEEPDSIQQFIRKCVEKKEGNKISGERVYKLYSQFAGGRNMRILGRKKLTEKIKGLSYAEYSNTYRFEGEQKRGFKNIAVEVPGTGDGLRDEKPPETSPKLAEPSPKQSSKEQKNRGGGSSSGTKGKGNRENRENGDGYGEDTEEKVVHPVSKESEKKNSKTVFQTGCSGKSSSPSPPTVSTPTQRDKVNALHNVLHKLQDDYGGWVLLSVLKDEAEAVGISHSFVDEFVERESKEGRLLLRGEEEEVEVSLNE